MTRAINSMQKQKTKVIVVHRHCQVLGIFQLRAVMGQQLSTEQKYYVRTLKQALKANVAIVSED
jgi:hypothetical protein